MPLQDPFQDLGRMDASFSSSSRRAAVRRSRKLRRRIVQWTLAATGLVTVGAFTFSGELNGLGLANGEPGPIGLRAGQSVERCPVPAQFRPAFTSASKDTGIPLALLVSVAEQESSFEPGARSSAGAEGLLQLMPGTARELDLDSSVPRHNVLAGARYLDRMIDRFGSEELALAAYNAGPAAVEAAAGRIPPATQAYVSGVTARAEQLAGCV